MVKNSPAAGQPGAEVRSGILLDPDVALLLAAIPSMERVYLEMAAATDEDPDASVLLAEMADRVTSLLGQIETCRPELLSYLSAVETLARSSESAEELVGWAFLDSLGAESTERLLPWIGPCTLEILETMECPAGDESTGRADRPGYRSA
jgi:hypothetical protein